MRLMTNMGDIKTQWKERVLRVIVDKTKGMQLLFGKKSSVWKADPGVVCGELVVILFSTKCQRWVHRCCSDVARQ